jgi:hypothetical protein
VPGAASGVVPVEDDGEGLVDEVTEGEVLHFDGDDEEKEEAGFGSDEVESGENSKKPGRGPDHGDGGIVAAEDARGVEEEGVEKDSGHSAEKVEGEVGAAGHPSFDVGAEDEEAEAIHGEVQEARVEELEGEESPELEFVEGFLNAEAAPGVE